MEISSSTQTSADRRPVVAALSVAIAFGSLAFANFGGGTNDVGPFLVTGAFVLVVAAIVFGWVVPRAVERGREPRTALVLAALGLIGLPVFWSGLTQVVVPAALLLGYGSRRPAVVAALALATLAYLAAVLACVVG
jgi:hypothetical protein